MKNLLLIIILTMVSCKDKLPSNIKSAVFFNNLYISELNNVDSVIINLNDNDIKKLSLDSARNLYSSHNYYKEMYDKSYDELQDLLKHNAIFSNYDEVKNRRFHFTIENVIRYEDGTGKINKNIDKLYEKIYN